MKACKVGRRSRNRGRVAIGKRRMQGVGSLCGCGPVCCAGTKSGADGRYKGSGVLICVGSEVLCGYEVQD